MAGEYLLGAIELFEQHPSNQQMGPGHRSEREDQVGALENQRVEAISTADCER
jgi:hypothetical protein